MRGIFWLLSLPLFHLVVMETYSCVIVDCEKVSLLFHPRKSSHAPYPYPYFGFRLSISAQCPLCPCNDLCPILMGRAPDTRFNHIAKSSLRAATSSSCNSAAWSQMQQFVHHTQVETAGNCGRGADGPAFHQLGDNVLLSRLWVDRQDRLLLESDLGGYEPGRRLPGKSICDIVWIVCLCISFLYMYVCYR